MKSVDVFVCIRPYRHDVVDTIKRTPKFNAKKETHSVRYKNKDCVVVKTGGEYILWLEEEF